jgi:hypothetical protein
MVVLLLGAGASPLCAGTTSASFLVNLNFERGNFGAATGWFFTPTVPIKVDELGIGDDGGFTIGFASSHDIGIFRADNGAAQVTTTFPAGTHGTLLDGTWYLPSTPVTLNTGMQYYIVANGCRG